MEPWKIPRPPARASTTRTRATAAASSGVVLTRRVREPTRGAQNALQRMGARDSCAGLRALEARETSDASRSPASARARRRRSAPGFASSPRDLPRARPRSRRRPRPATFRRARATSLPRVRPARPRLCARALLVLHARRAGCFLMQGPRLLSILLRQAHGRHGRAARRPCAAPRARAPVGALVSLPHPLPARLEPATVRRRARHRHAHAALLAGAARTCCRSCRETCALAFG